MRRLKRLVLLLFALPVLAQDVPPAPPADAPPPPVASNPPAAATARETSRDTFPNLNLYLPEGEFDLRVRKLIRNVLFESQISYNFVDGDVSTFLRYKYYARDFTYKVGVFDEIGFDSIDSGSRDFDRVRGGLLLFELPRNYNQRYFLLTQVDGLTYGEDERPDNDTTNVYTKFGFQQGTPFDQRLNSIVGESRGRIAPVLTAFRDIGPQKIGFAAAITQGFSGVGGDYDYTKFEAEGLKRSDLTENSFVITRAHLGTFLTKDDREEAVDPDFEDDPAYQYVIPRYELFRLGARDAMKAVNGRFRGTDEVHLTNEMFFPIFRNRDIKKFGARWNNMYAIGYSGIGALSYETADLFDSLVVDAGLGFETSFTVRNYEVFMNAVYAHTIEAPEGMDGDEVRFSVRTSR
jgi:hypothetical protein